MANRYYIDTSIWRDYFEDRKDNIRPLGEFAFQFFKMCKKKKCILLYSELVFFELKEFAEKLFVEQTALGNLLVKVLISKEQKEEARNIATNRTLFWYDVLHAILARDNNATMVTRDKHFEQLQDIVESRAPEEITFD